MPDFTILPTAKTDQGWVSALIQDRWGSEIVVSRGRIHHPSRLPGFAAFQDGRPAGVVTYHIEGRECEIVSLDSLIEGIGIGTGLIQAVKQVAVQASCQRLWLITTNDNLAALRFYQKRGFHLAALYPNALEESRKLKPQIPLIGLEGIPLRDEIELEMTLRPGQYG